MPLTTHTVNRLTCDACGKTHDLDNEEFRGQDSFTLPGNWHWVATSKLYSSLERPVQGQGVEWRLSCCVTCSYHIIGQEQSVPLATV